MVKVTLGVDGMMCGMCEAHVADCIRRELGGDKVKVSRGKKNAEFVLAETPEEEKVRAAIDATGYTVTSFKVEDYKKKGLFG